jgi:hypothetical protein
MMGKVSVTVAGWGRSGAVGETTRGFEMFPGIATPITIEQHGTFDG